MGWVNAAVAIGGAALNAYGASQSGGDGGGSRPRAIKSFGVDNEMMGNIDYTRYLHQPDDFAFNLSPSQQAFFDYNNNLIGTGGLDPLAHTAAQRGLRLGTDSIAGAFNTAQNIGYTQDSLNALRNRTQAAMGNMGASAAGIGSAANSIGQSALGINNAIGSIGNSAASIGRSAGALSGVASSLGGAAGNVGAQGSQLFGMGTNLLNADYSDVQAQQLALMREQAAPFEARQLDAVSQKLFNMGQIGTEGGARQMGEFATMMAHADIQRQLGSMQFAQNLRAGDMGIGAQLTGQAGQYAGIQGNMLSAQGNVLTNQGNLYNAQGQLHNMQGTLYNAQGNMFANQGQLYGMQSDIYNNQANLASSLNNANYDYQTANINRAQQRMANAYDVFNFGQNTYQQGLSNVAGAGQSMFNLNADMMATLTGMNSISNPGGKISSGASTGGNPFASFASEVGGAMVEGYGGQAMDSVGQWYNNRYGPA